MQEYLIKTFDKEEYARQFLNDGEMLFRHVSYFHSIEDGSVRGDADEGRAKEIINTNISSALNTISIGEKYYVNWEDVKIHYPDLMNYSGPMWFEISYIADIQIYCLTYVSSYMKNVSEIFDYIKQFGDYSVVITDCVEFVDRVRYALDAQCGRVTYDCGEMQDVFMKKMQYKNQSEFRIIIDGHELINLKFVGPIRGFLCKTSELPNLLSDLLL